MRVRVLGSCRVDGHGPLGRRDRVVLAALVAAGPGALSADRLAEALYGEEPPATWRKVVQGSVLRLRHLLGARAIETTPGGYRLSVGDDEVDARRFERLAEQASELVAVDQAARAVPLLREALGLFEGEPLAELDGWGPGCEEAARLGERRRQAEEQLAAALLSEGRVDEAVTVATGLASREPLREQRWVLLAQAYNRADRQADALRAVDRARRLLREELGVEPGPALVAVERAVLDHDPSLGAIGTDARRASSTCPYKGLAPYNAGDADEFFGRDDDVAACVARLLNTGVLAIVGPSGSGKSSLARAGVLPAIRRRGQAVVAFTPGADPVARLGRVPPDTAVVVDQLEELFTMTTSDEERRAFTEALARRAVRAPIVVTLRADFVAAVGGLPALTGLVEDGLHLLGPMSEAQLRAAITGPATRAGLRLEPGLVDLVVRDVEGQTGALPLLSHALAETWAHRDDRVLTVAGYRAGGGVQGAVAATADGVLDRLPPDGRRITRSVFLRLISLSDAGAPVSHRVRRADLVQDQRYDDVVDALLAARLLTADAESVEVAHEALGRAWPRLRTWLDEDREGQRILRHLVASATEWDRSGHDDAELYRGGRLRSADEWIATATPDLTTSEKAFLECSRDRQTAEEEDLAAQAAAQRRTNRRLRAMVAGIAVLLVVALISGGLFLRQRNRADESAREAAKTAREATARRLATESAVALDQDPELSILLALQGVETTRAAGDAPLPEAISALQTATQSSRVKLRRDNGAFYVDASTEGALLATGSRDSGAVLIWDASSGEQLRTLVAPCPAGATCAEPYVGDVLFAPAGHLVAVAYKYEEADAPVPSVILWDATTGAEVARVLGPARQTLWLAFSPDGALLAGSSEHEGAAGRVTVWDLASTRERFSFEPAEGSGPVTFRDQPPSLLVAGTGETVGFYSSDDGHPIDSLATPGLADVSGMALDPTGELLALGSQASRVTQMWDLRNRDRVWSIDGEAGPIRWSPGGDRIAIAGGNQSPIRVVDATSGTPRMVLLGHESGTWDVAFTAGGELASVTQAGGLRVWDVTDDGPPSLGAVMPPSGYAKRAQFSPDGSEMVVDTDDGTLERIAVDSGVVLGSLPDQKVGLPTYWPVASSDWHLVASVDAADGRTVVRDLQTLEPTTVIAPCASPLAFSPDGSQLVLDGLGPCTPRFGSAGDVDPTDGSVLRSRVVDIRSGQEILDLGERGASNALFNPGGEFPAGRYLVVDLDNDTIEIYDMTTRTLLTSLDFRDTFVWGLSFDPQGRWLAGGGGAGHAWVLDLAAVVAGTAGRDAIVFDKVVDEGVTAATSLSGDGLLATAGLGDGRVSMWNVSTGELAVELPTVPSQPSGPVAFSPDGSYVVYNDGGVLRRYPLQLDRLIELARSRLTRGLTADECRRHLDAATCP